MIFVIGVLFMLSACGTLLVAGVFGATALILVSEQDRGFGIGLAFLSGTFASLTVFLGYLGAWLAGIAS